LRIGYIGSVTKAADQANKIAAADNVIETHEHKGELREPIPVPPIIAPSNIDKVKRSRKQFARAEFDMSSR